MIGRNIVARDAKDIRIFTAPLQYRYIYLRILHPEISFGGCVYALRVAHLESYCPYDHTHTHIYSTCATRTDPNGGRARPACASNLIQPVQYLPSSLDFPEYDVFAIHLRQLGLVVCEDHKELRRVGVLAGVRHGEGSALHLALQPFFLVVELAAVDGLTCKSD